MLRIIFHCFMLECFREERNISSRVCTTMSQCRWEVTGDQFSFSLSRIIMAMGPLPLDGKRDGEAIMVFISFDSAARFAKQRQCSNNCLKLNILNVKVKCLLHELKDTRMTILWSCPLGELMTFFLTSYSFPNRPNSKERSVVEKK